jgi:acyl-coenzyme A synthetase/AMP-(fatty) acid ligase
MHYADLIFHHALTRPEKPAIILADRIVTYGMMARGIMSVEDRLRALRLPPGGLVALAIEAPIRHMIVSAALFRLGHPTIAARRTRDIPSVGLPIAKYLEEARDNLIVGLDQAVVEDDWFAAPPRPFDASPAKGFANGNAVNRISLSSGTTGQSKLSAQSIDAFNFMVMCYFSSIGQGNWDRMLCLPMMSSLWLYSVAAHALYAGKTLCFAATERDTLQMIAVYGVDCLVCSVPNMEELLVEQRKNPVPIPSLRTVLTGGSLPSRRLLSELQAGICANIVVQYGATEVGGTSFALADRLMATEGAVGFVTPWSEVQVLDDDGRVLPPDTDGILRIRSICQAGPYPDEKAAGDSNFRDGWFYPGDFGRGSAAGMLIVRGRLSELIHVGGAKIAPEAIEEIARRHPAVADAAAFGGTEPNGGEEIWLAVVPRGPLDSAGLTAYCAAEGYDVARVVAVSAIPRTALGKVERERLKRELRDAPPN